MVGSELRAFWLVCSPATHLHGELETDQVLAPPQGLSLRSQRERRVAGELVGIVAGSLGHHWVAVTAELGSPLRSMKGRGEVCSWSSPRVSPVPGLLAGEGMLPWTHTQGSSLCPEQGFPVPSLSESRTRSFGTGRRVSAAHLAAAPTLLAVPEGLRSIT